MKKVEPEKLENHGKPGNRDKQKKQDNRRDLTKAKITESEKQQKDMPHLVRNYLLIRTTVAFIAAYLLDIIAHNLVQRVLYPVFNRLLSLDQLYFHIDPDSVGRQTMLDLLKQILAMFAGRIFRLGFLIPADAEFISYPDFIANQSGILIALYMTAVIMGYIIMFLVSILPFILVGLWMYRQIMKLIDKLRKDDADKRLRYEKERNLMLADMAHDIKTPITSVVGVAKALDDGIVPQDKTKKYLHTVYSKAMRISELTDQLFEYVKMDSEGYSLNISELDFGQLVLECCAEVYTDFENEGIELVIEVPEVPMPVNADNTQLRRVINNLLSNEIKYLDKGNVVKVSVEVINDIEYQLGISDDGMPIEDELLNTIFEPFRRGDKTRSTKGGSGLGLSIAHKIIELHGGELYIMQPGQDEYSKTFMVHI